MPAVLLDGHTSDGKKARVGVTLLPGHYHNNHLELCKLVANGGWHAARPQAHSGTT